MVEADIEINGTVHFLNRTKKRNDSLANQQGAVPEAIFGGALTSISRDDYKNMFSLDDDSLEAGGQNILASEGELGRLLFSAASGLSGISNQLQTLKDSCATIYAPRSTKTELADLEKETARPESKITRCGYARRCL